MPFMAVSEKRESLPPLWGRWIAAASFLQKQELVPKTLSLAFVSLYHLGTTVVAFDNSGFFWLASSQALIRYEVMPSWAYSP